MNTDKAGIRSARAIPEDIKRRLEECLDRSLATGRRAMVFFRADDIGVPGIGFARLLAMFGRHQTPLALAVVPAWITAARWRALRRIADKNGHLWCWHQHGWRHANHEPAGKKQEFGPSRPTEAITADLEKGKRRLERILGPAFTPVFTPPWNRCTAASLDVLARTGFAGVSRFAGAAPLVPSGLAALDLHVDLHTRKNGEGWPAIIAELGCFLAQGRCGIMIHHRRMGESDFVFLDLLLGVLAQRRQIVRSSFPELAAAGLADPC